MNFATMLKALASIGQLIVAGTALLTPVVSSLAPGQSGLATIIGILAGLSGIHAGASAIATDPKKH